MRKPSKDWKKGQRERENTECCNGDVDDDDDDDDQDTGAGKNVSSRVFAMNMK